MYMIDFTYANNRLSDYGCVIAGMATGISDTASLGSNLQFDTLRHSATFEESILRAKYEENVTATFDIIKDPCQNELYFTDKEISFFLRWLNRKQYDKFYPIYNDDSYPSVYYKGTFNVTAIKIGGKVIGFTLTFNSNSPFGYSDKEDVLNVKDTFVIYNDSDEIGYLYPSLFEVTCGIDGSLEIENKTDDAQNKIVINNCVAGETITFDCVNKIIQSSESHTKLYNDFNYNYPRLVSADDSSIINTQNVFVTSMPCSIRIVYSSHRKAGIIV